MYQTNRTPSAMALHKARFMIVLKELDYWFKIDILASYEELINKSRNSIELYQAAVIMSRNVDNQILLCKLLHGEMLVVDRVPIFLKKLTSFQPPKFITYGSPSWYKYITRINYR